MATLSWKDNRLATNDIAPYDTTVMLVGPKFTVAEMVKETIIWCESKSGQAKKLMIYCHGSAGFLQICKDNLLYKDLDRELSKLSPYIAEVSIHACSVAKGQSGKTFCTKMASVMKAPVTAAVELQKNTGIETLYGYEDDRKYDGIYYIHYPSGARSMAMMTV